VGISDIDGQESITSICPLQDTGICDDAEFTIDTRDMEAYIGWQEDSQYFVSDNISLYYGNFDGSYFCSDNWDFTFTSQPNWLSVRQKLVTAGWLTDLD
jgi:hypothetical protein